MLETNFLVEILEKASKEFRDRIFPPIVTLAAFLSQVLSEDHSCCETVASPGWEWTLSSKAMSSAGWISGRGIVVGTRDHLVEWQKPARPAWMDKETYAAMPDTLRVRETKVGGLVLVSSFLDPKDVPKEELDSLYRQRWQVEIDLKFINKRAFLPRVHFFPR